MHDLVKRGLAAFVPIAILLGMIVPPLYTVAVGEPVKLRMEPVDPTDAFRGDYIQVNLEAETVPESRLDRSAIEYFARHKGGELNVYALLKKDEAGICHVKTVSAEKPRGGIYLKGKAWEDGDQKVYIDYHLDKFFVPQHAGKEIEQAATKGRAAAVVKIYRGRAVITNLVTE